MLLASVVTPHSPKLADPGDVPAYALGVRAGSLALGEAIRALEPDLLVLQSVHWATPFLGFAATADRHCGLCDDPDASRPLAIAYDRPGDAAFAGALVECARRDGLPLGPAPDYPWDYGAAVPLGLIDPAQRLPVVLLSTCLNTTLDEGLRLGAAIRRTAGALGRRTVFVASSAFAARLVRGPRAWPPETALAADRHFLGLLANGDVAAARAALPAYAAASNVEMGARPLATFLGCLDPARRHAGRRFGDYGAIAGSGHVSVMLGAVSP